jgi:IS1 family transposase
MKTCFFVKYILVAETDKVPDYEVIIEKHIGGNKQTRTVNIRDLPINNTINA